MKDKLVLGENYYIIKRSRLLIAVDRTYQDKSTDYLIALRDALSIVISRRLHPCIKPLDLYEGYILYHGDMKGNIDYGN